MSIPLSAFSATAQKEYGNFEYGVTDNEIRIIGYDKTEGCPSRIVIPSEIEGLPVSEIGFFAFANFDDLESVEIPSGVKSIGDRAFENCGKLSDEMCIRDSFKSVGTKEKSKKRLQIEAAVNYINTHYAERITLDDLAELCELSTSYFCKLFKSEIGESFADYLTWVRMEKAIELLRDPKMKIYEISEAVGYSDVQYFNKVFRDTTGVSPSFYRNHLLYSCLLYTSASAPLRLPWRLQGRIFWPFRQ